MYYYLITTDNVVQEIKTENRLELNDYYKLINCECISYVMTDADKYNMIIDDEGKLNNKELNLLATLLYNNPYDVICGDVIICTDKVINSIGERDFWGFETSVMQDIQTTIANMMDTL